MTISRVVFNCGCVASAVGAVSHHAAAVAIGTLALLTVSLVMSMQRVVPVFRSSRSRSAEDDLDHMLYSSIVGALASRYRLLWLHHRGHGTARVLNDALDGIIIFLFHGAIAFMMLRSLTQGWNAMLWFAATSTSTLLDSALRRDGSAKPLATITTIVVACSLAPPDFSWAFARAALLGFVVAIPVAWVEDRATKRRSLWRLTRIDSDRDVATLRSALRPGRIFSGLRTMPSDLLELDVGERSDWPSVVTTVLERSLFAILCIDQIEDSEGLKLELGLCWKRDVPVLLVAFEATLRRNPEALTLMQAAVARQKGVPHPLGDTLPRCVVPVVLRDRGTAVPERLILRAAARRLRDWPRRLYP